MSIKPFLLSLLLHGLPLSLILTSKISKHNISMQSNIKIAVAIKNKQKKEKYPIFFRPKKTSEPKIEELSFPRRRESSEEINPPDQSLRISDNFTAPVLLSDSDLPKKYPKKAKMMRLEGEVLLLLTVGISGDVINTKVMNGPDKEFFQAALEIGKSLKFIPAKNEKGEHIIAQIEHRVIFKLKD